MRVGDTALTMSNPDSQDMPAENDQLIEGLSELDELRERGLDNSRQMPTIHQLMDELDTYVKVLQEGQPTQGLEIIREPECERAVRGIALASLDQALSERTDRVPKIAEFESGQSIGLYELIEPIGQGGMGTVYRARHKKLNQEVALKVLPSWRMRNPKSIARFEREMRAVGKLNHPGIVRALDAGEANDVHFLAMEYVDGVNLSTLLRQSGTLAVPDACEIILQVSDALQYIHDQGLIHRDIKPSNLMMTRDGQVNILDLGLAHVTEEFEEEALTRTGQVMGTLDYMAPEQALDSGKIDHRADIYSLGVTFYKLLAGVTPFEREQFHNPLQKTRAMLDEHPPSIRQHCSELPDDLVLIVDQMLSRDVQNRFQTAMQVSSLLVPFCAGCDLQELSRMTTSTTHELHFERSLPLRTASNHSSLGLVGGVFLSLVFFVTAWAFYQSSVENPVRPQSDESQFIISRNANEGPDSGISKPIPGFHQLILPNNFDDIFLKELVTTPEGPVLVGSLGVHASSFSKAFAWQTDAGFLNLDALSSSTAKLKAAAWITSNGSKILFRGDREFLLAEGSGLSRVLEIPIDFQPRVVSDDGSRLIGVSRVRERSRFRNAFAVWHEGEPLELTDSLSEEPQEFGVYDYARSAEVAVGFADTLSSPVKRTPWLWSESTGLVELILPVELTIDQPCTPKSISDNGRYISGTIGLSEQFVFDHETQTFLRGDQLPDGEVIAVDNRGVLYGNSSKEQGWIQQSNEEAISLRVLLKKAGYDFTQIYNGQIVRISPDGRYLAGQSKVSAGEEFAWVLDLEACGLMLATQTQSTTQDPPDPKGKER